MAEIAETMRGHIRGRSLHVHKVGWGRKGIGCLAPSVIGIRNMVLPISKWELLRRTCDGA